MLVGTGCCLQLSSFIGSAWTYFRTLRKMHVKCRELQNSCKIIATAHAANMDAKTVCIEAVRRAGAIYNQGDAEAACRQLAALNSEGLYLQQLSEERKENLAANLEQLKEEENRLEATKNKLDCSIHEQENKRAQAERELQQKNRSKAETESKLARARQRLVDAHKELERAKAKEKILLAGSITAGVVGVTASIIIGAVTMGVGAPIAGAVVFTGGSAGAAGIAAIAALITKLNDLVGEAERDIESKEKDIEHVKADISKINSTIRHIGMQIWTCRQQIASNKKSMQQIHQKITDLKHSIVFEMSAIEFWGFFQISAVRASEKTERLQRIVNRATERRDIKILRSNGTITKAENFVDAWEEVAMKQGQVVYYH